MAIKVAFTDDHPLVLNGLQNIISSTKYIEITGQYGSGAALLEGLRKNIPDILLLDMQLPDTTGKELAREVLLRHPSIRIIVLTSLEDTRNVDDMMQLGCIGYLLKSATDQPKLLSAIEKAYNDEPFVDEALNKLVLTNILKRKKQKEEVVTLLTRREKEVLRLITNEYTSQEIADELSLSIRTVEFHRLGLLQKLQAKNTAGLVKKAFELQLLD